MSTERVDVMIVGGGLVGLTLARLLRACGSPASRIAVVERAAPPPVGERVGLRVSALSPASRRILERCGAWPAVPESRVAPYRRMQVWRDGGPAGREAIEFDAADIGVSELGYIVENDVVRAALWEAIDAQLVTGAVPVSVHRGADEVMLNLDDGRVLSGRLLVGADGAQSWVRSALGIAAGVRAYGQRGVVTHVASERPHEDTARQRFLPDGPLALLPLADGRSSVVWSCAEQHADELLALDPAGFGRALTEASEGVLGKLTVTEPPAAFPLAAAQAGCYVGERFALVGDAAHRVHPLAGQGVNLGLMDAAVLTDVLAAARGWDVGDARLLRRYERGQKGHNLAAMYVMDALHQAFSTGRHGLAAAAGRGLGFADRMGPLKRVLARQALGQRFDTPRAAAVE